VPISSRSIARKPPETTGLFDAARLAHMKRTAFILDGKPIRDKVVNKKVEAL
jgi:lactate dehydrogenase-like 2-hydroxyacid dehydrogenase